MSTESVQKKDDEDILSSCVRRSHAVFVDCEERCDKNGRAVGRESSHSLDGPGNSVKVDQGEDLS